MNLFSDLGLLDNFEIVSLLTRIEVVEHFQKADVVVDQFCEGILGLIGIEAMAYQIPVVGYVNQRLMRKYFNENLPLINIYSKSDVESKLGVLMDKKNRAILGAQWRKFVKKHYSVNSVSEKILKLVN